MFLGLGPELVAKVIGSDGMEAMSQWEQAHAVIAEGRV